MPPVNLASGSGDTPILPPRKGKRTLWIIVALIIAALIAGAVFVFFISPQMVLSNYLSRVVKAKTTTLATSATSTTKDYKFNLRLSGKSDLTTAAKPKADYTVKGEISSGQGATPLGSAAAGSLTARLLVANQTLYFKIENFSYLTQLLSVKVPDGWYKYDIDTSETGKCLSKGKGSGSLLGNQVLTSVPVKQARFAGIETVNSALSLHYTGAVDNAKVQAAVDKANKALSADCKLDISADDYKDIAVTYDFWRGWSKDRLKLKIADTKNHTTAEITLDTSGYNQPVKIDPPTGAKDVSELFKEFLGSAGLEDTPASPSTTRTHVPATTATSAQKARDTTRKTDITILRKALEEYFVSYNYYPKTLAELTKSEPGTTAILTKIPTDPTNKAPYSYSYVPATLENGYPTTYTLRACLENAADTGSNVIDPVAPCKTATFEIVNAN